MARANLESKFQRELKAKLYAMFPGCYIIKQNAFQGIPDLLILWRDKWAMLEVKRSSSSPFEPNQEWYLEEFNNMAFAACIYPENEQEVLDAIQLAFLA